MRRKRVDAVLINLMYYHAAMNLAEIATPVSHDRPATSGTWVVSRRDLQRLLARQHPPTQRGIEAASRRLLYAGTVPGHHALFAKIVLVRPLDPESTNWRSQIWLRGHGNLVGYGICLSCGDDERLAVTDAAGEASFDDVPATWIILDTAPDLIVTIH